MHRAVVKMQAYGRGMAHRRRMSSTNLVAPALSQIAKHSRTAVNGLRRLGSSLRIVGNDEKENEDGAALAKLLQALRLARVDYLRVRPFGDDRIYICLSAALSTLHAHAEHVGFKARLKAFPQGLPAQLHRGSQCVPYGRFTVAKAHEFVPFSSRQRLALLRLLLEHKGRGGAGLDLSSLVYQGVLSDVFALHHAPERQIAYAAWASPGMLAPLWPPRTFELTLSEAPNVPAAGGYPLVAYCGERAAFFLLFYSYYSAWLLYLAAAGIATLVTLAAVLEEEEYTGENHYNMEKAVLAGFSVLTLLWAFGMRKGWTRRERMLARRWDVAEFDEASDEAPRPQFVGVWRTHPVTGERELWASPLARAWKYVLSGLLSIAMLVVVIVIQMLPEVFGDAVTARLGISDSAFEVLSAVYTAVAVELFGWAYRALAWRMTAWENHRTKSSFKYALNMKVFIFMCVNCYFSVSWIAFVAPEPTDLRARLSTLGTQLSALLCSRAMALLIGGVYLPHTSAQHKYTAAKERSKATAAAKGEDFAAAGQEMWENTAHSPNPGLRPVYADAHLSPSDEYGFDDTIAAFAIQYGFVIGFAAAMPALSVLALAINVALLRASAFKMLWVSRREWPFTASGLGVWDKMLETLTVLAAFSNGWLIADLMDLGGAERDGGDGDGCAVHPVWKVWAARAGVVAALLVLRLVVHFALPDEPRWVGLIEARLRHFSRVGYQPERLAAAIVRERDERRADWPRRLRLRLLRGACVLPTCVWQSLGGSLGLAKHGAHEASAVPHTREDEEHDDDEGDDTDTSRLGCLGRVGVATATASAAMLELI